MEESNQRNRKKNKGYMVNTFPVMLNLNQIRENIDTNLNNKISIEEKINQAITYHLKGNITEAAKLYKFIISQGYNDPRVFSNYGVILKSLGKLKEAELLIRKAIKYKTDFADAYYNLGNILHQLGKLEEAELSIRKVIELKSNYTEAYANLAKILQDLGKLKEAELSIRKVIELKPNLSIAHYHLGMILINLGNPQEAEISLSKAIELEPNFTSAIEELARRFYLDKKYDLAIKYLRRDNSDNCQSLYLGCLLCLDKKREFEQKYKELSSRKICNADMSGIIEHSNIIYENNFDSDFCNDAIQYVMVEKINEVLFNEKDFNQLISYIKSDELKTKPQSLIHQASQSTGNLFLLDYPFIKSLKNALEVSIELYKERFKNTEEGFIKNWPTNYTLRSWILSMKTGGFIKPHNHRYGWITGSFYLNVPKSNINDNSGNISFSYQGPEYPTKGKKFNSTIKKIETRDICIFPSSLFHHTIPFKSSEERICLVFDLAKSKKKEN